MFRKRIFSGFIRVGDGDLQACGTGRAKADDYNSEPTEVTKVSGDSQSTFLPDCPLYAAVKEGLEFN